MPAPPSLPKIWSYVRAGKGLLRCRVLSVRRLRYPARDCRRAQPRVLRLERCDAFQQRRRCLRDLDVLGAVDVPGLNREQDRTLGARAIAGVAEAREQRGIVLDHARASPELDPPLSRKIEQEQ